MTFSCSIESTSVMCKVAYLSELNARQTVYVDETSSTNKLISVMAAGTHAVEATDANFNDLINSDKPVLVDFWAEWCGPCKMIGPVVEQLAGEYEGKAVVAKMDVDQNAQVPAKFGIRSIPTLMVFKNGQLVDKVIGATSKNVLEQKLTAAMEPAAI